MMTVMRVCGGIGGDGGCNSAFVVVYEVMKLCDGDCSEFV